MKQWDLPWVNGKLESFRKYNNYQKNVKGNGSTKAQNKWSWVSYSREFKQHLSIKGGKGEELKVRSINGHQIIFPSIENDHQSIAVVNHRKLIVTSWSPP